MVIRMRHTRAHTRNRRSHHALEAATVTTCAHCGKDKRPHHMCLHCGYYRGRQVINLEAERAKRDARIQAKHDRIKAEAGPVASVPEEAPKAVSEKASPEVKEAKARASAGKKGTSMGKKLSGNPKGKETE